MKTAIKYIIMTALSAVIISCSTGGGGGTQGGGNTPVATATGINLGNISTIPLSGTSSSTAITVTNNMGDTMILQGATYTLYTGSNAFIPLKASGADSPIDVTPCGTVPARGQCSVQVHAPVTSGIGQYLISMTYLDTNTNKPYTTSQIVSYSDAIPVNPNGIIYASNNNNIYNQVNGNTTMSVPFVLAKAFNSLTAVSDKGNPAFIPTINCSGSAPYPVGTMCTLLISISGTNTSSVFSGNIIVSGETTEAANLQNSSKSLQATVTDPGKSLQGNVSPIFNVPVTVTQNNSGNLVTSAINVVVNPANGVAGNAQVVTLLNNGSATISGINIAATSPLTVTNNTCGSTLSAPSGTCTFSVNVNTAQTTSGQAPVTVTYSNGASSGNTTGSISFNVVYIAATAGPALTMTSGQGSLSNVMINTTQYFSLLVKNTGNVTLTNITFTNTPASVAGLSYDTSSTCATNGTQSLVSGASCTLVLKYAPTVTASGTLTISTTASYVDSSTGGTSSYAGVSSGIPYSAITSPAFLYISPNYISYAIRADGSDSVTQGYTVYNSGAVSATSLSITAPSVTGFSSSNTCTATLAANTGCVISTTYGPTSTALATTAFGANQLQASYLPTVTSSAATIAFSNLVFTAQSAAFVNITNIVVTGTSSGSGVSATPYLFNNTPTNTIGLTITYSNTGNAAANNFNVATNNLPVGYIVSGSSTCGYGATTSTLAATTGSCTLIVSAVGGSALYNPYAITGSLNLNIPGYSYNDVNTALNTMSAPTWSGHYGNLNTIYVTPTNVLTVTPSNPTTWTGAGAGTGSNVYTFTGTATSGALVIYIPSTSGINGGAFTFTPTTRTCTLSTSTPYNCTITIANSPNVIPVATYNFGFKVLPVGTTPNDSAVGSTLQGSFTYTN